VGGVLMEQKVLVIEDETSIQKILQFELMQAGFRVDLADDGEMGLNQVLTHTYDVVFLDVMLPKKDGFSVCKELRKQNNSTYVVMLSARDDELDRIQGLDVGADDYMTKPFSAKEVVSKAKAIVRRKEMSLQGDIKENYFSYQRLRLYPDRFEVLVDDEVIDFTLKEYELLVALIENKGKVLTRDSLLDRLWGVDYFGDSRALDVHMFKVRDKLKPYDIKIKTVRGVGYMLEDESK